MKSRSPRLLSTAIVHFETVARHGSIRAAAEALNVAPSAISRQIAKLEQELGAPLFERLPRGLQLTSAGEILLHHARATAAELDRARAAILELRGLKRGEASLATVESVALGLLPRLLGDFWKGAPLISGRLIVTGSARVFHAVAEGEAELGLAFEVPASPKLKQLASVTLPIGAVMSPRHPLAGAKSVRFRDFIGRPVFLSDTSLTMRPSVEAALRDASIVLAPRMVTNSVQLMNRLAVENTGVAFETRVGISREEERGELVFVPLTEPGLKPQRLRLCCRPEGQLSPAGTALGKALAAALSEIE